MLWALLICSGCLLFYLGFVLRAAWYFHRIPCNKPQTSFLPFVSVVIPARNEAAYIRQCLLSVLQQDYPSEKFELILVDDHSTDETLQIAQSLQAAYPKLKTLNLSEQDRNAYKKAALSLGIETAKGEIILQTDGDCQAKTNWLRSMLAQFEDDTVLVSGPVHLTYEDHWLPKLQSLEYIGLVCLGAGSLAAGSPNMANGANLAYRKAAFEAVGGFKGVDGVASGDDEFLLHKLHQAYPGRLRFAKCPAAIIRTPAQPDWSSLRRQRLRWVSKARAYQNRWVNVVQLLSYLGFVSFPLTFLYGFWYSWSWGLLGVCFLLKCLTDYVLMRKGAAFFHKLPLLRWLIPLELLYIPYVLWIGIAGNLISSYEWKGRKVK